MKSHARYQCEQAVQQFAAHLNTLPLTNGKLLYVGIAGDPPGGEYTHLFKSYQPTTFDIDAKWKPDIVGDITRTKFDNSTWDAIVIVQTIEHIPNIWDLSNELWRILKPGGYLIVDCPWNYRYHGEPEFGDYWRISKDGMEALFQKNFELVQQRAEEHNTSCLYVKKV